MDNFQARDMLEALYNSDMYLRFKREKNKFRNRKIISLKSIHSPLFDFQPSGHGNQRQLGGIPV